MMMKVWRLVAVVVIGSLLAAMVSGLTKDDIKDVEDDIIELAGKIAEKYRGKCDVSAECEKSISSAWYNVSSYLDRVDSRVNDVCNYCVHNLLRAI